MNFLPKIAFFCISSTILLSTALGDTDDDDDIRVVNLHIESRIQSRFAVTTVQSEIHNLASEDKEVSFHAQLPADAFISNFTMLINGRLEIGEVKEKEEAKEAYEKAKSSGHTAGLVEQKPRETDLFKTSINVAAGGKVKFELTYQEVLKRVHGVYKHVINVLSAEKAEDLKIDVHIMERGRIERIYVPEYGPNIGVKTNKELLDLEENDDAVVHQSVDDGYSKVHITYNPETKTSGQFAVLYDLERAYNGGELEVVDGYIVHFFAPHRDAAVSEGATNLVFVLDRSGSMQGRKFVQLQEAMRTILADLKAEDRFSIIWFSTEAETWDTSLRTATKSNIREALAYVNGSNASGSTNIHAALIKALDILKKDSANENPDMILFLTDGLPTAGEVQASDDILQAVRARNKKSAVKIHNLAFGNDADYKMLQKMSKQNNGLARKIYEASDAKFQLEGFYSEIASPLFTNLKIRYLNGKVDVSSIVKNRDDDTFYKDSEIMVLAKLRDPTTTTVRGEVKAKGPEGSPVEFRCGNECFGCCTGVCPRWCRPVPWPCPVTPIIRPTPTPEPPLPANTLQGFVERMWAYMTIKNLLKDAELEDNKNAAKAKKDRALRLSLQYNFVTELTSMVIVDQEADLAPFDDEGELEEADYAFGAPMGPVGLSGASAHGRFSGRLGRPAPALQPAPGLAFATYTAAHATFMPSTAFPTTTSPTPVPTPSFSICRMNLLIIIDSRSASNVPDSKLMDVLQALDNLQPAISANVAIARVMDTGNAPVVVQSFKDFRQISSVPSVASSSVRNFWALMNRFSNPSVAQRVILILSGSEALPLRVQKRVSRAGKGDIEVFASVSADDFSHELQNHLEQISGSGNFLYAANADQIAYQIAC